MHTLNFPYKIFILTKSFFCLWTKEQLSVSHECDLWSWTASIGFPTLWVTSSKTTSIRWKTIINEATFPADRSVLYMRLYKVASRFCSGLFWALKWDIPCKFLAQQRFIQNHSKCSINVIICYVHSIHFRNHFPVVKSEKSVSFYMPFLISSCL